MQFKPGPFDYEDVVPSRNQRAWDTGIMKESPGSLVNAAHDSSGEACVTSSAIGIQDQGSKTAPLSAGTSNWLYKRGHQLSFVGLFLFSAILYLRPYELVPALSSFQRMAFYTGLVTLVIYLVTQLSLEGNVTARPMEVNYVLLLVAAALLSMPLAINPLEAWDAFSNMLLKTAVIFIVIVNVVRTDLRLKMLLLLVLGVSVYLSINAIYDYQQGVFQVGALATGDARIAGRIKGLFENSNDLALHLVTMVPLAVGLAMANRNLILKILYFGGAGIMIGAIIVTFSRGGFLGLVAATFVLARRLGKKNRFGVWGALIFAVILFFAFAPGAYSGRLSTIFDSSADLTQSSSQRTDVFKRSIWVALRYPLFGVGIGNFHHKSIRELETHNAYTQVAAEMGIAAMIIYIAFLIYPLKRLRLIERESLSKDSTRSKFYYLAIAMQSSLWGYIVSSFFGAVAYHWYVYYLVGYAVCLHRLYLMRPESKHHVSGAFWERPFAKKNRQLVEESVQPDWRTELKPAG
jgi:O-antigen ligase